MGMPDTARRYTVAEVLEFPSDGNRYELVDGELLVTPAPRFRHQEVLGEVFSLLHQYLRSNPRGKVLLSPADITWGSDHDLAQPDIFVVAAEEARDPDTKWEAIRTLLLAVEIISPSSTRYDRVTKRRLYQRRGVAAYWVVDPDARLVEVWHPDDDRPEIVTEILRWRVTEAAPQLEIPLASLFGDLPK